MKIMSLITPSYVVPNQKIFAHLWSTNEDIFDEICELSDPAYTTTQLKCSQTQKLSKNIDKTVHVTSVAQIQLCKAKKILFVHKESKNIITYSTILLPELTSSAILESTTTHVHAFPRT